MDQPYIGAIFIWAGNFAPQGYMYCAGQTLQIQQYNALYAILGTTYGGDGRATFMLPNLCGRMPIGISQAGSTDPNPNPQILAARGGSISTNLTVNNLPAHNHPATFTPTGSGTPLNVTANLSVSTAAATAATPTLTNGSTAYLANAAAGTSTNALKGLYATAAPVVGSIATIPANTTASGGGITGGSVAIGNTGGSVPVNTISPFIGLNFIIAINGLFPPRN